MAIIICSASLSRKSQLTHQTHRNENCFPRIQIQLSTLNFHCDKSPLQFLHIHRDVNKKWVVLQSRKNSHRRKSIHQENESQFISEENNVDGPSVSDSDNKGPSTSVLSVLCPLLKLFSGGDPSRERNYIFEEATSSLSTLSRFAWGSRALFDFNQRHDRKNPPIRLQLFEFEACPFCRRVREALTELDLSVEVYPCPKGSVRHREMVKRYGGKEQFPFLVDPNTGISLYESSDIVKYLFQQYGKGRSPSTGLLESTIITGWMPTILRAGRGMTLWEQSRKEEPARKLELFSYENNPYARIVRETLCELELPYVLHNVGEGSSNAPSLFEMSGSKEVPFLFDPNTGQQMGDYKRIISYLFQTYSVAST